MVNRQLASAFNAWWDAVLRRREVLARCQQVGVSAKDCLDFRCKPHGNLSAVHHAKHVNAMLGVGVQVIMVHHVPLPLWPVQFALRLVNQDLAAGMDAFKWNRVNKHNKRLADKHYFTRAATKVGPFSSEGHLGCTPCTGV
jgi:hypothetical protein